MDTKPNDNNQARNRARRGDPSRKRGRPPGQRNTVRLPPLRLTLNLDDPAEAALAQVLQDALEQEERGKLLKIQWFSEISPDDGRRHPSTGSGQVSERRRGI